MTEESMDAQSRAFREATEEDWVTDEQIAEMAEAVDPNTTERLPEEYEEDGWDLGREGPKSLEDAIEINPIYAEEN